MDLHKIQIASLSGETMTASIDVQGARVLLTVDNDVQLNLSESEAWALSLQLKLACRRAAKADGHEISLHGGFAWSATDVAEQDETYDANDDEPSGGPP